MVGGNAGKWDKKEQLYGCGEETLRARRQMETSFLQTRKWELAATSAAVGRARRSDDQRLTWKTVNLRTVDLRGCQ